MTTNIGLFATGGTALNLLRVIPLATSSAL